MLRNALAQKNAQKCTDLYKNVSQAVLKQNENKQTIKKKKKSRMLGNALTSFFTKTSV